MRRDYARAQSIMAEVARELGDQVPHREVHYAVRVNGTERKWVPNGTLRSAWRDTWDAADAYLDDLLAVGFALESARLLPHGIEMSFKREGATLPVRVAFTARDGAFEGRG